MKIFAVTDNYKGNGPEESGLFGWRFLPDSSIFRAPNPYFADEETDLVAAFPSLAIRIDRIGKSVSPRFASRYTFHAALSVNIRNLTLENLLRENGLPVDPSWGYDRSLLLSDWVESTLEDMENIKITVGLEGGISTVWQAGELIHNLPEVISVVSRRDLLKMGDIILPGFHHTGLTLLPGTIMSASLDIPGKQELKLHIPIK